MLKNDWKFVGNTTKPGNPLWDEYVNVKTGQSTLQKHTPRKITNYDKCDHHWVGIDFNGNIQCKRCGLGKKIVWGIEWIHNGKITKWNKGRL